MMKRILLLTIPFLFTSHAEGQWIPSDGIYGGLVTRIIQMENKLIASTNKGDVFVSSDTGKSWINTHREISNIVKAGKYIYGGEYISADKGLTWSPHSPMYTDETFIIGDSIFVTGSYWYGNTMCSTDSGYSWHTSNIGLPSWNILREGNNKVYAASPSGIYVSSDNFNSWIKIDSGFVSTQVNEMIVKDSIILALTSSGLYCSVDTGNTWNWTFPGTEHLSMFANRIFINDQFGYLHFSDDYGVTWDTCFYSISLSSLVELGGILFNSNEAGIYKSIDSGSTWVKSDSLVNERDIFNINVCGPYLFASGFREGLYRSGDYGRNWQKLSLPFNDIWANVTRIYTDSDTICLAVWGHGILISKDYGTTWNQYLDTKALFSLVKKGNIICGADVWGIIYCSNDGGDTWNTTNIPNVFSLAINNAYIFASGYSGCGIYRSSDNGINWTQVNPNQNAVSLQENNGKLYAGSYNGDLSVSPDNGLTWSKLFNGTSGVGWDFKINNNRIWLINEKNALFYSNNNGMSFDSVATGLPYKFYSVCVTDSSVLLGTDHCVWRSGDSATVGIKEISKNAFSVFPNPSGGTVNITLPHPSTGDISVYDVMGRTVIYRAFSHSDNQKMDLSLQPKGIYFLKVKIEGCSFDKKIILTQ